MMDAIQCWMQGDAFADDKTGWHAVKHRQIFCELRKYAKMTEMTYLVCEILLMLIIAWTILLLLSVYFTCIDFRNQKNGHQAYKMPWWRQKSSTWNTHVMIVIVFIGMNNTYDITWHIHTSLEPRYAHVKYAFYDWSQFYLHPLVHPFSKALYLMSW